jgi:pimeloyl-ACP methyl ester carboxylesterase
MTTIRVDPIAPLPRERYVYGSDGTRLYVRSRSGPQSSGASGASGASVSAAAEPRAIFCDGILCDGYIWKYLWAAVAAQLPVAHWHYRGHGRSSPPADHARVHVADHADDLNRVRGAFPGESALLFGHSMGCQVALEAYRARPEGVRGMVLLCGTFGRLTETFYNSRLLARALPGVVRRVDASPRLARALWSRVPPDVAYQLALWTGQLDPRTIRRDDVMPYLRHMTHVDLPLFLNMLQAAGEHDAEDVLEHVECPTLVVAGERDSFTPPRLAQQMAERMPNAEFFLVPGGTHAAPLEQPDLIDERVLDFLRRRVTA